MIEWSVEQASELSIELASEMSVETASVVSVELASEMIGEICTAFLCRGSFIVAVLVVSELLGPRLKRDCFVLCAFALSVERLVLSVWKGLCSQWREACALSGERLVLSVERGLCLCAFWLSRMLIACSRLSTLGLTEHRASERNERPESVESASELCV